MTTSEENRGGESCTLDDIPYDDAEKELAPAVGYLLKSPFSTYTPSFDGWILAEPPTEEEMLKNKKSAKDKSKGQSPEKKDFSQDPPEFPEEKWEPPRVGRGNITFIRI